MDQNLTQKLRQKMAPRPRVSGRFNSSELYFINNGYTTPEEYLNPKEKSLKEMFAMWNGTGMHNQIEGLLDEKGCEVKVEVLHNDEITLVGKADYLPPDFPDEVWEFKTSEKLMQKSKPWHEYQAKLYCTMFQKGNGLIYQPVQNSEGLYLKHLGTVTRDDEWFNGEMEKLYQFHLRVKKIWTK